MMSRVLVSLLIGVLLVPYQPVAQEQEISGDSPIRVTADRLEADEKSRSVVFYGRVQTRKDNFVIYADKMVLFYGTDGQDDVDRIEIEGHLRIVQADRVATADRGVFKTREGTILLAGNAEVHQGGNSIVGDEIVYYLNEARSEVKSQSNSRVNAVFSPGGQK